MREVARISMKIKSCMLIDIISAIVTTYTVNGSGVVMDLEDDDAVFYVVLK